MLTSALLVLVGGAGGWWYFGDQLVSYLSKAKASPVKDGDAAAQAGAGPRTPLIVDAPDSGFAWPDETAARLDATPKTDTDEILKPQSGSARPSALLDRPEAQPKSEGGAGVATRSSAAEEEQSDNPAVEAARRRIAEGKVIDARHALNALLRQPLSKADQAAVQSLLTALADETIFSKRRLPDDPLVDLYTVKSGEVLVRIGREFKVPAEVLMRINGIKDASKLRADQKIKVLKGPFHAKIYKSEFRLDVYLQDFYVRSFRVGLGVDQGTPEGVWRVKERLENPTYYPSPSTEDKRIIAADDPKNPLGERWIGLEGVEGDAVGRDGYGIHGTIEPESIGKAVSLGCIRMHNEDVEFLYDLMLPGQSTVAILP